MWAAAQRHPDVTELLIEAGAEINAQSRTYAQTVVGEQTQRFGREELNYTVLRGGSTPLLFAARSGDTALGAPAARGRGERQRRAARWHQRAGARRAQRSRRDRGAAAREGRESECRRLRLYGAPCGGAAERPRAGQGAARAQGESRPAHDQRHAAAPRYDRLQSARDAHRLDSVSARRAFPRAGDHEGARRAAAPM